MKLLLSFVLTGLFLVGCGTTNRMTTIPDENLIDISKNDQEQYELIVLDPGFDTWYATTWSPAKDHAESYYSYWNQRYVTAWNYKATRPLTAKYFENIIMYDPTIHYGIELERKLYYYFRYVDTKLGIPILDSPPPAIM